jgi:hypothetical protein
MRKNVFGLLIAGLLLINNLAYSQTEMVWDSYGLGFTLAKGMRITQNDGETFSAEKPNLFLTIQPVKNMEVTVEHLAEAVIEMATAMEYESISDADELELNDLYGFYVEGTSDGASSFVVAMMDVESHNNYLAVVVFTPETRDAAIELIISFFAYDE